MNLYQNQEKPKDHFYFHTPSEDARRFLFYPVVAGVSARGSNYRIHRQRYDSFLLLYVLDGCLFLNQNGTYKGEKGDLLLVDCYAEHEYFTDSYVKMIWLHFDGSTSRPWVEALLREYGALLRGSTRCPELLNDVISAVKNGEDEYQLSNRIHTLLCDVSAFARSQATGSLASTVREAKVFMEDHLEQDLSVEQIAAAVHFSPSHFSKIFKDATKTSPYEYLLSRRIERAKKLLLQTQLSLNVVAERSGFHSLPHFICAFKQATGLTPLKFRKLNF